MISVKIDSAQFTQIEAQIRTAAKEILSSPALKKEIGEFAVERLKYQARTGKPFNETDNFPSLKESTIRHRKYLARHNTTHETYGASRSNLTITGELLDSLRWRDEGDTLVKVEFSGMHKPYVGAKGQRISKTIMNETLAKYLEAKGFKVFDTFALKVNAKFIGRIKTICLRYIRRGLRIRNALRES